MRTLPFYPGATEANSPAGIGSFKRMKTHILDHVESVRDTMFRDATREVERALRRTLNEAEWELEKKVEGVVTLINKDYSALLVNQNVFKALSTARDEVQYLLSQVDQQFEMVLRPLAEPPNLKSENTAVMDIHHSVPASANAMADHNAVRIKIEPSVGADTSMEDA